MWKPIDIKIDNFMAYANEKYEYTNGVSYMVQGRNLTDDGQTSNGACKSAILEATAISLTGTCVRLDTSVKDLVMRGEKSATITMRLRNDFLRRSLEIKRTIFSNTKSATLEVTLLQDSEDGEVNITPDITSVREGDAFIIEVIGVDKSDLLNYYIISKERYVPFYKQPDSKKKEVIGRFSNANLISPAEESLDNDIDRIERDIQSCERKIEDAQIRIDTISEDMATFSVDELKERRDKKIKSIKDQISEYNIKISKSNLNIKDIDSKLDEAELKGQDMLKEYVDDSEARYSDCDTRESHLKKMEGVFEKERDKNIEDIDKEFNKSQEDINNLEKDLDDELLESKGYLKEVEKLMSEVEKSLTSSVECPKCSHEFSPSNKNINIEVAKSKKKDIQKEIDDVTFEINEIKSEIDGLDDKRARLRKNRRESVKKINDAHTDNIKDIVEDLKKISSERLKIAEDKKEIDAIWKEFEDGVQELESEKSSEQKLITSYNNEVTTLNEELLTIEEYVIKDRKIEFEEKISAIEDEIKLLVKEKDEHEGRIQVAREKKEIYIRFKTHLSNKAIASIEAHSNNYLEVAKSNIRIQLDGYKQTKSGDIREKITTSVIRDGINEGGIGAFSSGEKGRIEISNILAMKRMINNASPTGGLDLLILDEVTNSLDSSGIGGVQDMLMSTKETSIHITHSTFDSVYPYIRTAVKKRNVSKIIEGQYED